MSDGLLLHYAFEACIMRQAPVHNAAPRLHIVFGSVLARQIGSQDGGQDFAACAPLCAAYAPISACIMHGQYASANSKNLYVLGNFKPEGLHYARFRCALCAALCTALCTQIRCILLLWISSDAAVSASTQFIGIEDRESSYGLGQEGKSRAKRVVHNATFHCL